MAIEKKVYAFMRIEDKTISQVDDFLNDIKTAHHRAITSAKVRLQTQNQLDEEVPLVDE